jgi:hypothetical protein
MARPDMHGFRAALLKNLNNIHGMLPARARPSTRSRQIGPNAKS